MENYTVKKLMIPLSEYATVTMEATLFDAVLALEKAQIDFDHSKYRHRAILVLNKNGDVVGKMSQLDVLRALEPKYDEIMDQGQLQQRYGFSKKFMKSIMSQYKMWDTNINKICLRSGKQPVTKFMHTLTEGEHVDENAYLAEAIHLLVMGQRQSLLVTRNKKIIGVLRLTDVFAFVFHTMKECFREDI